MDTTARQEQDKSSAYQEIAVLSIVPALVGFLTTVSWILAHWNVGPGWINAGLALIATLFGGYLRFVSGFKDILQRKITVNVFVAVALAATLAIGEFRAAAIIVFIMAMAGAFETYTLDKTRRSIRGLLDLTPKTATLRREGQEVTVPVLELQVGDIALVRPGGRIPVDGVVIAGDSCVNQAPITGESIPVDKTEGSEVFGGTLNETGRLEIRATKVGSDTTLAQIVHLVEQAQGTRAPIQNLADRFTAWFLPTVVVLAIIAFVASGDIRVAVAVLLVACPCAFAIATPTAVTAGISNMARRAVLIKGGIFLELAHKMEVLLVDKTGTFTFGKPQVVEVIALGDLSEEEVLQNAAVAEKYSEHPLARAILAQAEQAGLDLPDPEGFEIEVGKGVLAEWEDHQIRVGKPSFIIENDISLAEDHTKAISAQTDQGRTTILVARDNKLVGLVAIADGVRPEARDTVAALHARGVQRIVMLTGDNTQVAQAVARDIGVDEVRAELLPEDKLQVVKEFQQAGHTVGMIGDGINDAPALAQADVGIAMGAAGTDVAVETADVALMNDDLSRLVQFMCMAGKVMTRIKLNIFFSMAYNIVGFALAGFGLLTPVVAVLFQEAGCITVVFSSTLLLWAKLESRRKPPHPPQPNVNITQEATPLPSLSLKP